MNCLDALIFDCDGVLAETERDGHRVAFNRAFLKIGLPIEWSVEEYGDLVRIGGGKERLRAWFKAHCDTLPAICEDESFIQELHAEKTRIFMQMSEMGELPVRDGILRLFDEAAAAGLVLCVCSTAQEQSVRALVRAIMGEARLARFNALFAGDVVQRKKPAPDIYQLALDRFSLDPERCFVVEDSGIGLQAAKSAGMHCLVTVSDYTAHDDFTGADLVVSSLGDPGRPAIRILSPESRLSETIRDFVRLNDLCALIQ